MSRTGGEEHRDKWIITPRLAKPSSAGHPTASTSSRHLPLRYATIYAYASILCPLACDLSLPCSRSTGISYIQCPCAMLSPFTAYSTQIRWPPRILRSHLDPVNLVQVHLSRLSSVRVVRGPRVRCPLWLVLEQSHGGDGVGRVDGEPVVDSVVLAGKG